MLGRDGGKQEGNRDGGREASAAALSRGEGSVSDKNNEQHPHSLRAEHELTDPERAGAYRLINVCANRTRAELKNGKAYILGINKHIHPNVYINVAINRNVNTDGNSFKFKR